MSVLHRVWRARSTPSTTSHALIFICRSLSSSVTSGIDLKAGASLSNRPLPLLKDHKGRNVQWVFLGCPGVGKGTYASKLSNLLGVPHIATGDLVRDELASSGPLASQLAEIVNGGKLVSDEIIINLLSKRLEAGEAKGESGFILDGFPRTIRQAEILEGVTDIDLVVNLKLREEALVAKCLGRRICSECGGNYNIASIDIKGENGSPGMYMAPLLPPPHCASKLITRPDDTEEVVKERLRVYNEMTHCLSERSIIRILVGRPNTGLNKTTGTWSMAIAIATATASIISTRKSTCGGVLPQSWEVVGVQSSWRNPRILAKAASSSES